MDTVIKRLLVNDFYECGNAFHFRTTKKLVAPRTTGPVVRTGRRGVADMCDTTPMRVRPVGGR